MKPEARLVAKRVFDKRILKPVRSFLAAGVLAEGLVSPTEEGAPQVGFCEIRARLTSGSGGGCGRGRTRFARLRRLTSAGSGGTNRRQSARPLAAYRWCPSIMLNLPRTAVCEPARTVVGEGRSREVPRY